ncbi:MAG: SAM-dependent methyltransferase [Myxococcales bacterium]|nr:SAM-dependent methyltransferase [Myxococcales bacterium]
MDEQPKTVEAALKRTPHLSYFRRYDEYYLFHDRIGYILKMSRDLIGFIEFFNSPRQSVSVHGAYDEIFGHDTVKQFVGVLKAHQILQEDVADAPDERWRMRPTQAAWIVSIDEEDGGRTHYFTDDEGTTHDERLSPAQCAFWRAMDGDQTLREIVDGLRATDASFPDDREVLGWCDRWAHSERQLLKFSSQPLSYFAEAPDARPPYLASTMPYARIDPAKALASDVDPRLPRTTTELMEQYHVDSVSDAWRQFDIEETTLSHLFREPHPALGGKTYAARLAERLFAEGHLNDRTRSIWEIGGGTGAFALGMLRAIRDDYPQIFAGLSYTILELSPELQRSQRELTAEFADRVRLVSGHAESFDFPAKDADLVISNEMIGDLTGVHVTRGEMGIFAVRNEEFEPPADELPDDDGAGSGANGGNGSSDSAPEASDEEVVDLGPAPPELQELHDLDLDLHDAPPHFWLNLGAYRLVARIYSLLRPGGSAVITEFGEIDQYPIVSTQLDHPELSIHFGLLSSVAQNVGFRTAFRPILQWLFSQTDLMALATTRTYFKTLTHALALRGIELRKIAYTLESFVELLGDKLDMRRIHVVDFRPLATRTMGLVPSDFKALLLRRPGESAEAAKRLELF